ncbi:MAG: thiamine diphosphokinase [Ruminococcaceae bacterium]|nr:thiamine diphosphokinase [Oscillospiraceae bacterium]
MKKGICYIVGACDFNEIIKPDDADYIIAADGGYKSLCEKGITPDAVMGDFDSLGFVPGHKNIIKHPPEKDDTDTALALNYGYEMGYRRFLIFGGIGGRLDHTLANMQTVLGMKRRGCECYLIGGGCIITALENESFTFSGKEKGYLSLFAADGKAENVTLKGLKYPLDKATLYPDITLAVSNEFIGEKANITTMGALFMLWYENFSDKEGSIYENNRCDL